MGLFSANCKRCGHPLLCKQATNDINRWMTEAVMITPEGDIHTGEYDGYGRVGGWESAMDRFPEENSVYHKACWVLVGKPLTFQGRSEHARDQGWFFDEGAHDLPCPTSD